MTDGIPPTRPTDSEDVVWALQTADALWKRNERVDAIVWLRRAAQAAGEANDNERAAHLARNAAELSELVASTIYFARRLRPKKKRSSASASFRRPKRIRARRSRRRRCRSTRRARRSWILR